mmetsp:Transcript_96834/g.273678  ORF Transcript_96834/g.273678 Transcript_96834/m.273678 type:complete len:237 (+) Transcript_96834:1245-1955(+)
MIANQERQAPRAEQNLQHGDLASSCPPKVRNQAFHDGVLEDQHVVGRPHDRREELSADEIRHVAHPELDVANGASMRTVREGRVPLRGLETGCVVAPGLLARVKRKHIPLWIHALPDAVDPVSWRETDSGGERMPANAFDLGLGSQRRQQRITRERALAHDGDELLRCNVRRQVRRREFGTTLQPLWDATRLVEAEYVQGPRRQGRHLCELVLVHLASLHANFQGSRYVMLRLYVL